MSTYCIVALDGGGVRGAISAVFLDRLYEEHPTYVDHVDLFAGTSIGAANAVALAGHDRPLDQMIRFYEDHGQQLFAERYVPAGLVGALLRELEALPLIGDTVASAAELFWPKWSNHGLRAALRDYFDRQNTLGELRPNRVLLTTLALDRQYEGADVIMPVCMTNFDSSPDLELDLHDALLRSMSAPGYFTSTVDGFVDGGTFATNPTLAAIAAAVEETGCHVDDLRVLSIGTGVEPDAVPTRGKPLAWGALEWGRRFPEVAMTGQCESVHLMCRSILGKDRYCRLNVTLHRTVPLDDPDSIDELIGLTTMALEEDAFRRASDFVGEHFSERGKSRS